MEKLQMLSPDQREKVAAFVEGLLSDMSVKTGQDIPGVKAGFGGGKGFISNIAEDFDKPLEDFKDYM